MKYPVLKLAVLGLLLGACASDSETHPFAGDLLLGASLQRAIVTQSALFPYHFVPDAAELNELGERDLGVIAAHLRDNAGTLIIRRGTASKELHDARVAAVLAVLEQAGVQKEHVALRDGLPGGDGLPSSRLVEVFKTPYVLTGAGVSQVTATATGGTPQSTTN